MKVVSFFYSPCIIQTIVNELRHLIIYCLNSFDTTEIRRIKYSLGPVYEFVCT